MLNPSDFAAVDRRCSFAPAQATEAVVSLDYNIPRNPECLCYEFHTPGRGCHAVSIFDLNRVRIGPDVRRQRCAARQAVHGEILQRSRAADHLGGNGSPCALYCLKSASKYRVYAAAIADDSMTTMFRCVRRFSPGHHCLVVDHHHLVVHEIVLIAGDEAPAWPEPRRSEAFLVCQRRQALCRRPVACLL